MNDAKNKGKDGQTIRTTIYGGLQQLPECRVVEELLLSGPRLRLAYQNGAVSVCPSVAGAMRTAEARP